MKKKQIYLVANNGSRFAFDKNRIEEITIPNIRMPKGFMNLRIRNNKLETEWIEELLG